MKEIKEIFKELMHMIENAGKLELSGFNYAIEMEKDRYVCYVELSEGGKIKGLQMQRLINTKFIKDKENE